MKGMGAVPGHSFFFSPSPFCLLPKSGLGAMAVAPPRRGTCITLAVSYHSIERVGLFRVREARNRT